MSWPAPCGGCPARYRPASTLTRRAAGVLAGLRSDPIGRVRDGGTIISGSDADLRWWTWAGYRANATLKATLGNLADESQRVDDLSIRLRGDLRPQMWSMAVKELGERLTLPEIDDKALSGLKFSDACPSPRRSYSRYSAGRPGSRRERAS
jgi:ATP-dependent Lhr-like helicase